MQMYILTVQLNVCYGLLSEVNCLIISYLIIMFGLVFSKNQADVDVQKMNYKSKQRVKRIVRSTLY